MIDVEKPLCQCCGRNPGVKKDPMWRCQSCLDARDKRLGALKKTKKPVKAQFA